MRQNLFLLALAAFLPASSVPAAELWIGAAQADITPDRPVALTGGMTAPISTGINSRVTVNVVALESRVDGKPADQAIFVSCDLCVIRPGIQERFRTLVAPRLLGFDINKLVLASTHTHKAPAIDQDSYDNYVGAIEPKDYVPFLFDRMAEAVVQAWNSRKPGAFAWGLGHAVVGQNRRAVYASGAAEMYGKTDRPDFLGLEGYEDHAVDCLFFLDANRNPVAIAVALACPAQTDERGPAGPRISADFWHDVREGLRAKHGAALTVLGFCAPAGDQSPHLMLRQAGETRMAALRKVSRTQELGRRIVKAVEDTWEVVQADVRADVPFVHRVERFDLPERTITEAEVAEAKKAVEVLAAKEKLVGQDYWRKRWNKRVVDRFEAQKKGATLNPVEMHVLRLCDVAVATNPFELYTDYGVRIQARSPAGQTVLIQLASPLDKGFYLPTPRALAGKGYSAIPQSCLVGPEGGQLLVEKTLAAIKGLFGK